MHTSPYVECLLQTRCHTDEPAGVSSRHIEVVKLDPALWVRCMERLKDLPTATEWWQETGKVMLLHVCSVQWGKWRLREWPLGFTLAQEAHDCVLSSVP